MTQSDMLKEKLVAMFKWFHTFCEENGLTYYMLGGTMLGAVRHGGFIPWDDDIDIGMPREDYNKLALLLKEDMTQTKYVLETPDSSEKDFYYPFSKIYDTDTTLIENTKTKIKRGIYLDIFPLDGIGNSAEEGKKNFEKIQRMNQLLLLKVAGFRKGRSAFKNLGVALFRIVPVSPKYILRKLVSLCGERSFYECSYVGNLVGAWGTRELMPREVMGHPTLYTFEDMQAYGAENADAYLTSLYGNWRQLPPVEKRVTHHDFVMIDLEKSYLERK